MIEALWTIFQATLLIAGIALAWVVIVALVISALVQARRRLWPVTNLSSALKRSGSRR